MSEDIYKMKLHDEVTLGYNFYAVRVPGGWIYRTDMERSDGSWTANSTFVPYSDEFMVNQGNSNDN